jgi:MFS family permease
MFQALRNPAFFQLWLGGTISSLGDMVLLIALPFHVYNLTGSTMATGITFMAQILPRLLLGSVGGVFADRWDRKWTMIATDIARAAVLLPLLLVRSEEWVWLVYLVSAVKATLSQFFGPARSALLPRLVTQETLVAANALSSATESLVRLVGPTLGGALLAFSGLTFVVLLDAVSYLVSAVMIARIRLSPGQRRNAPEAVDGAPSGAWRRLLREWSDGWKVVRESGVMFNLVLVSSVAMVAQGLINVLLVPYVKEMLGGGSAQFGWLATAQGIGGLAGGLVMGSVGERWLTPRVISLSLGSAGVLFLLMVHFPALVTALVLIALIGFPSSVYVIGVQTLLQTHSSDRYRGRVFGIYGALIMLAMIAGMGLASILGDVAPLTLLLDAAGTFFILASLLGIRIFGTSLNVREQSLNAGLEAGSAASRQELPG